MFPRGYEPVKSYETINLAFGGMKAFLMLVLVVHLGDKRERVPTPRLCCEFNTGATLTCRPRAVYSVALTGEELPPGCSGAIALVASLVVSFPDFLF